MFLKLKPPQIFYGWWIVAAAFVVSFFYGGMIAYGFTAIFEPIAQELGWSHTEVSFAASIRGLEMGLAAPLVGFLVDRLGPRRLLLAGAALTSLGLFLLSQVDSLIMFYAVYVLISIGATSSTVTVLMTAVAHWFKKKIGLASGIAICGYGFSGLLIPVIVALIDRFQWRTAIIILAFSLPLVITPLAFVFRHKPEPYGYLPDGVSSASLNAATIQDEDEANLAAGRALKTSAFWQLSGSLLFQQLTANAIVIHIMPYLSTIGFSRSLSGMVASAVPLASIIGRLSFGWLGDRIDRRIISAGAFVLMGTATFLFGYASIGGVWLIIPFFVLFGIGHGGNHSIRIAMVREFFGRRNFGTISGLAEGMMMIGNFIGPPLAGWVFDTRGSYTEIWFALALLSIVPLVLVLTARRIAQKDKTLNATFA